MNTQKVQDVARHLPGRWYVLRDNGHTVIVARRGDPGVEIMLRAYRHNATTRWRISGLFPAHFYPSNEDRVVITVSSERPAATLAADIARRLLSTYLQQIEIALRREREFEQSLQKTKAELRVLSETFQQASYIEPSFDTFGTIHFHRGRIRTQALSAPDKYEIRVRGVTFQEAQQIAQLLSPH